MVSKNSKCTAEFEFRAKEPAIQSLNFSVAVKDLKGDNDLMNKRAYKALKAYPYSDITYTGKLFTISHARSNKYLIKTEGNLRIGGVTHAVSIPATLVMNDDGTMSCTGSKSLKMSDYKIKLPEVLVKNMNIQNTVIIDFKLVFAVI